MKKFAALLVLLSVLMCAACTKETAQEPDVNYTDNYIYANMNGTFFRFCVDNATASPLCPDPLCGHNDEGCPFFHMEGNPFSGGSIYTIFPAVRDMAERPVCAASICRQDGIK